MFVVNLSLSIFSSEIGFLAVSFFRRTAATAVRLSSVEVQIRVVVDFGSSTSLLSDRNWDSSNNRYFVQYWSRNRNRSCDWDSSYNRVLYMMDFSFMNVFLDNRLGDDLFGRSIDGLHSVLGVVLGLFNNRVHVDDLVLSSVDSYLNVFSLDNRLDVLLVVDFFSWSVNSLGSAGVSDLSLSGDRVSVDGLSLRRNEVDFLSVVNNSSFVDWLGQDFFSRSLEVFVNCLVLVLGLSGLSRVVDSSGLSSLNIQSFSDGLNCWLDVLFSDGYLTRDINRNSSLGSSVVNNRVFVNSFSVYWSADYFLSDDRGLDDSLSDDWLGDQSLCDNRLGDDLSGNNRFGNDLLGLGDDWFGV